VLVSSTTTYLSSSTSTAPPPVFIIYVNRYDDTCDGKIPCYTTIQEALNNAFTGDLIMITEGTYTESLSLNELKLVTLSGGWDPSFTTQSSDTIIDSLRINDGCITVDNIVIQ
jgi:hypothetical protein